MGLRTFIAKRIVYSFLLVILVILVNFIIFMLMPGDPTDFLMQAWSRENPEDRQAHELLLRNLWGIGDPPHIQFAKYLRNLLTFELGVGIIEKRPVGQIMLQKIPYTVFLLGGATIISLIIGIVAGISVIQKRGSMFDSGAVLFSLIMNSLPTFWLGLMFLLIFYVNLGWFPNAGAFPREWAGGKWPVAFTSTSTASPNALNILLNLNPQGILALVGGYAKHVFLPMTTLVLFSFGGWLLLTRAVMLEVITEDYVVTARAKGLKERTVLYKHALKNASLPLITSAALSFGFILSGAIITETVYTYPGLGGWIWSAIQFRDYSVLMAVFYIISLCVIVANIIADLIYGIIDPRIKYG